MARRNTNGGTDKRNQIIRAAIKIFSKKGFFSSRVSDIARAAGVADGTIYLYFKNKDDLLISIFEEKMSEFVIDVRKRIAKGNGALEKLNIFIRNHMELLESDADMTEVMIVELRQSSKFLKDYTPVKFFEYLEIISEILLEGKEEGVFRTDLSESIARRVIFGAIDELSRTYVLASRKPKYHPSITGDEVCRILSGGLCAQKKEAHVG